jgi:hypothetical protein
MRWEYEVASSSSEDLVVNDLFSHNSKDEFNLTSGSGLKLPPS